MTGIFAVAAPIATPHIEYGQLSPMLLVFGVAVAGVLVEAFVPRALRRGFHLVLTLGGLVAAFALTIVVAASSSLFANGSPGHVAAVGAVGVDQPTLFIRGTILVLAFISVLLIAESSHEVSPFAAQAAAVPGSAEEREGLDAGITHTEVYPLTLFAVGGMLLFPASNDLLTMFVALEVLSLPLYLLCGLARRRRLLSQEAAMKYFLLGAFSSAFFLFGDRDAVRLLRLGPAVRHRGGGRVQHQQRDAAVRGHRAARARPAFQDRRGAVPELEAGRLPGCPDAGDRADGVLHAGGRVRRVVPGVLCRVRPAVLGLAAGHVGRRDPHHGSSARSSR